MTKSNIRLMLVTAALLIAFLASAPAALAQDGTEPPPEPTDDEVNAVARTLYCPVCENVPLDVCGTQACADWRDEIRVMLAEGDSEADIQTYFAERYGRRVLATPSMTGIDIVVWVLPPVGVLAGIVVLVFSLRRMAPGALDAEAKPVAALSYDDLDAEYVARLEQELQEFARQS